MKENKNIKIIISIPRANSTIIELLLGLNSEEIKIIHEPFLEYGYYDDSPLSAYQKIFQKNNPNDRNKTFLIKEMSHWITKDDLYKKILHDIDCPIIILIKNPILTIESKIIKILIGANTKNRPKLSHFLCSVSEERKERDSRELLDIFAQKNNYEKWDYLVEKEAVQKRNLIIFDKIIEYFINNSSDDIWGWDGIEKIINFLDQKSINYKIIDGLDFQLAPFSTINLLCKHLKINFSEKIFNFSQKDFKKIIDFKKEQPSGYFWYEEAFSCKKIIAPSKKPLSINKFPINIQKYIKETALPYYFKFCSNNNRVNVLNHGQAINEDKNNFKNYKKIDPIYFIANEHMGYFK